MQLYVIAVVQHHRFVANRFGLKFCFVVVFYYNKSMLCIIINNYRCVCVRKSMSVELTGICSEGKIRRFETNRLKSGDCGKTICC